MSEIGIFILLTGNCHELLFSQYNSVTLLDKLILKFAYKTMVLVLFIEEGTIVEPVLKVTIWLSNFLSIVLQPVSFLFG
jgi:hypothetical protein